MTLNVKCSHCGNSLGYGYLSNDTLSLQLNVKTDPRLTEENKLVVGADPATVTFSDDTEVYTETIPSTGGYMDCDLRDEKRT